MAVTMFFENDVNTKALPTLPSKATLSAYFAPILPSPKFTGITSPKTSSPAQPCCSAMASTFISDRSKSTNSITLC